MEDSSVDLLVRARRGDDQARERLYARLRPVLRRWARGQVPERARSFLDSEDLVQDVLTTTIRQVREFQPHVDHGLHAYLREVLRNRIRSELRRQYHRPCIEGEPAEDVVSQEPSPLERAFDDEARRAYEDVLAELPEEQRAMVIARVEFELPWHDVAAVGGKSSGDAARMSVARVVARLSRSLGIRRSGGRAK